MRLDDLIQLMRRLDLGEPGKPRRPPRENLSELQTAFSRGLADPDFALDCIEQDLRAWSDWEASGWKGRKPPIAAIPELGISMMFFFWPPGEVSLPHEHVSWTMSSVFHNRLRVTTYHWDRAVQERRLEEKNVFSAEPGRVGYIYNPCIHSPRNASADWATSIHIYNADDLPVLEKQVGPIEGLEPADSTADAAIYEARPPEVFLRVRECTYRVHAEAAARFPAARTMRFLEQLHRLGDASTQEVVARSMRALDPIEAEAKLRRL